MDDRKETLSYLIYMANRWCKNECLLIFGSGQFSLGEHIWAKWCEYSSQGGPNAATTRLAYEISEQYFSKIVERACQLYCGRANK